tara:strand:+ start:853 stop:1020 length:168 start_codon:yes stop_codon:yes gene_type:complete
MNPKNYNSAMVQNALKILKDKGKEVPTIKQIMYLRPIENPKIIPELFKTLRKENG